MSKHEHDWNFIKTSIGQGEPRIMQRILPQPIDSDKLPKMETWTTTEQEFALYHCVCGEKREVAI